MNINDDYAEETYIDSEEALKHLSKLNCNSPSLADTLEEEVEFGEWDFKQFGMGFKDESK
jgi:hypothetical protein